MLEFKHGTKSTKRTTPIDRLSVKQTRWMHRLCFVRNTKGWQDRQHGRPPNPNENQLVQPFHYIQKNKWTLELSLVRIL
jgi:hypothetical protein